MSKSTNPTIAVLLMLVSAAAAVPPGEGLVGYWDFNGRLLDRAGKAEDHLAAQGGKARFVSADDLPGTIDGAAGHPTPITSHCTTGP